MKPRRCGDIHVQIAVMNPVKPPEKWHLVIQEMPDIQHEIHECDRDNDLEPRGGLDHIQDSQFISLYISCSEYNGCREDQVKQNTVNKC